MAECPAPDPLGPYVPLPDPGECCPTVDPFVMCDTDGPTSFLRVFVLASDGSVVSTVDYDVDGAPYVAVGPVLPVPCDPQQTVQIFPYSQLIVGADVSALPATGVQSITVLVRSVGAVAGDSVVITTDGGQFFGVAGEVYTWSNIRGQDNEISQGLFDVTTSNAGDEVLILWTVAV